MPFEARQVVAVGFGWDARIRLAPPLHIRARDAYVDGQGLGQVSLQASFIVSEERATSDVNAGELYRYLAESVWFPTALLLGQASLGRRSTITERSRS